MTPAPLEIDVFSDVVCPWCLIGAHRLEQALDGREAVVRYHPFLLDPTTPAEGQNLVERLRRKYGGDPRRMQARVEDVARADGIALDFSRVERTYPTVAAHTLLRHAAARGTQRALAQELFQAYFVEGRNIADVAVLAELGARHGFTEDEAADLVVDPAELALTRRQAEAAARSGIDGVPFFVFNQRLAVAGAQPVDVLRRAIEQAQKPQEEDARE